MSMYYSLLTAVPQSTDTGWMADAAAAAAQPRNPRIGTPIPRVGAAIASVVVTSVLFASVAFGMTSMAKDRETLVAEIHATSRT